MTPRTLVFCFDGTGNEPTDAEGFEHDESISNVLKLHVLMGGGLNGEDKTDTKTPTGEEQRTYYYNGIGTREGGEDIPLVGWLVSKVSGLVNSALAPRWGDARRILKEAMEDFDSTKPQPQDRIVLFGFSRGAALARKFASMVLEENKELEVAFLGVFDTVAAMDGIHRRGETINSDVVFEDGTVNPRVERAVHILSLDEDRVAFEPTQMNRDPEDEERIHEIWFPGVHSDIGGGYWHDGLADVALTYMIYQCKTQLKDGVSIATSSARTISDVLASQGDVLRMLDVDDILIHPNVTGMAHAHTEGLGKLYSKQIRKVCVRQDDKALPSTKFRPLVHHSVKARFDLVPDYRPPALRGLAFEVLLPSGERENVRGIAELREMDYLRSREEKKSGVAPSEAEFIGDTSSS